MGPACSSWLRCSEESAPDVVLYVGCVSMRSYLRLAVESATEMAVGWLHHPGPARTRGSGMSAGMARAVDWQWTKTKTKATGDVDGYGRELKTRVMEIGVPSLVGWNYVRFPDPCTGKKKTHWPHSQLPTPAKMEHGYTDDQFTP